MAANTQLNLGSGGDLFKSDDLTSYKIAGSKIVTGAVNVDGGYVTPTNPLPVQPCAAATGGATPFHLVSAASTNATLVSTGAHSVHALVASNVNAAARSVKLFDRATAPTIGTTIPVFTVVVPAGSTLVVPLPTPLRIALGLGLGVTVNSGDTDTAAVGAGDVIVNLLYV